MKDKRIRSLYVSYNAITEPIVQSQVVPYLRELSKKGIKFYLLTFEKEKMTEDRKNEVRHALKKEFADGGALDWFSLRYHKRLSLVATLFDMLIGCFYSIYLVLKHEIDVVHARALVAAAMGYPAAKLLSKKFIFDTRGIDSEEYVDGGLWKKGGIKHRAAILTEGILMRASDHVVTLTERFLKVIREKYGDKKIKTSVIPCSVDTDRFRPRPDNDPALIGSIGIRDKFVITYAGSLGTWYMLSEMLDFFIVAAKLIENAHFLILTQTDRQYAVDLMTKKGLDKRYVTIDRSGHDFMPRYLSVSDLGIFFIKPVFSKLSSSPVKFAEYLSMGLPVIINSGIGDTDTLVRRYRLGAVVDKFDDRCYSNAIGDVTRLLNEGKDALRARCRGVAEKELSLKTARERYYAIYKELTRCEKSI